MNWQRNENYIDVAKCLARQKQKIFQNEETPTCSSAKKLYRHSTNYLNFVQIYICYVVP